MNILATVPIFMAGMAAFVGFHFLLVYSRLRDRRVYLSFAFACFLIALYDLACAGQYNSSSVLEAGPWQRAETVLLLLAGSAILYFIFDYTSHRITKARNLMVGLFFVMAFLALFDWNGLFWNLNEPSIKTISLPFDLSIVYYRYATGILYDIQFLLVAFIFLYLLYFAIQFYHSGHQKEAKPLLIAMITFFAGIANDALVAIGTYQFIFLIEYSYIGWILVMTYAISTAVAESVVVKEALQRSETQYRTLVETMPDGLALLDKNQNLLYINSRFIEMFGYEKEELLGQNVRLLFEEKNLPVFEHQMKARREGRRSSYEIELIGKGGRKVPTFIAANPHYDEKGQYQGSVGVLTDISERKRAEEVLLKAKQEAEMANQAKSDFLANMSHELRTPLNSIIGFTEVLSDRVAGPITPEQETNLQVISTESHRLLELINSILDLSKIETGKMELGTSSFSLMRLIKKSCELHAKNASDKKITISLEFESNLDDIRGDSSKILQVVNNLLSNAIKFTPDGGRVGISTQKNENNVVITVWDTGIGIAEQDLPKLFQPFQQIESPLTKRYQGTGLGLFFSKKLVELMGGQIWVKSKIKDGSRFNFSIPITDG